MAKKEKKVNGNYIVKTPVRMDGEDYAPGDLIQLDEEEAAELAESVAPRPIQPVPADGGKKDGEKK